MFDPPQAQDAIRQAPNLTAAAFQDDYLEAMVVVQMHVRSREDLAGSCVLGLDQLGGEIWLMVIVNHRQRAHNYLVFLIRLLHQMLANKVPYGPDRF